MKRKPVIRVAKKVRLHEWQTDSRPEEPVKANPETVRTLVRAYKRLMGKSANFGKKKDGTYWFTYTYFNGKKAKTKRRRAK